LEIEGITPLYQVAHFLDRSRNEAKTLLTGRIVSWRLDRQMVRPNQATFKIVAMTIYDVGI
jgi:hypothetical protein